MFKKNTAKEWRNAFLAMVIATLLMFSPTVAMAAGNQGLLGIFNNTTELTKGFGKVMVVAFAIAGVGLVGTASWKIYQTQNKNQQISWGSIGLMIVSGVILISLSYFISTFTVSITGEDTGSSVNYLFQN